MHRCLELAAKGAGTVAPNPMVGAVLVYDNRIIGEGYHQQFGAAHAEPNCLASVPQEHGHLVPLSTLYVSLEPCAHFGKTPPCADLIISSGIKKVVVGCRDPFLKVDGKGIEKLTTAGIEITQGVLEQECKEMNRRFFVFHTKHRPYIILKWAQTADDRMASVGASRLKISNEYTNRLVHKWRSEEMAIVVGTNTALYDDPQLTTRLSPGHNPVRIVVDMDMRLPNTLKVFGGDAATIVFNTKQHTLPFEQVSLADLKDKETYYYQVTRDTSLVHQMVHALYRLNVQSLLVEGGRLLLQSFIDEGMWDESRIITNEEMNITSGLTAPVLQQAEPVQTLRFGSDVIRVIKNKDCE